MSTSVHRRERVEDLGSIVHEQSAETNEVRNVLLS